MVSAVYQLTCGLTMTLSAPAAGLSAKARVRWQKRQRPAAARCRSAAPTPTRSRRRSRRCGVDPGSIPASFAPGNGSVDHAPGQGERRVQRTMSLRSSSRRLQVVVFSSRLVLLCNTVVNARRPARRAWRRCRSRSGRRCSRQIAHLVAEFGIGGPSRPSRVARSGTGIRRRVASISMTAA